MSMLPEGTATEGTSSGHTATRVSSGPPVTEDAFTEHTIESAPPARADT